MTHEQHGLVEPFHRMRARHSNGNALLRHLLLECAKPDIVAAVIGE